MKNLSSRTPRLHSEAGLGEGAEVVLAGGQAHYLQKVMRLQAGDPVRLFNGDDGEWLCQIVEAGKKTCRLRCGERLRKPGKRADIDYLFAPLKQARLDYLVQKATEMGAGRLRPVFTAHTMVSRLSIERMRANVIEAAEQCNLTVLPEILEPQPLGKLLAGWDDDRRLIFCDETASVADPLCALRSLPRGPLAVLVGPEGGFRQDERELLHNMRGTLAISLGPRVMRADTAAVAALALVQATLGDFSPSDDGRDGK